MKELENFIAGRWVGAEERIDDIGPATGEVIATIPRSTEEDVSKAIDAAAAAFEGWAARPASERADVLDAIADGLESRGIIDMRDRGNGRTFDF